MDILDYPFEIYNIINNKQRTVIKTKKIKIYGNRKINKDLLYNNNNESK